MEAKKFYTLEEIEDKYIGEKGTPPSHSSSRADIFPVFCSKRSCWSTVNQE